MFYFFSYIATSDRDEKIRITNYPAVHEIEAFCVGHKEFVSSVAFLNNDELLISSSGDKTLRFWNYKNGKQIQSIDLSFVPITIRALSGLQSGEGFIAISSNKDTIYIYSYQIVNNTAVKIHLLDQKSYSEDYEFTARGNAIFIKSLKDVGGKKKLLIDQVTLAETSAKFKLLCDVTDTLCIEIDPDFKFYKHFDVSLLFKKRYDNDGHIAQYEDRKRARIESQVSKKKKK